MLISDSIRRTAEQAARITPADSPLHCPLDADLVRRVCGDVADWEADARVPLPHQMVASLAYVSVTHSDHSRYTRITCISPHLAAR